VSAALLIYSFDYLLKMRTRSLLGPEGFIPTINQAMNSRDDLILDVIPSLREPYQDVTEVIKKRNCKDVGIMISGGWPAAEYPLWHLLGAPKEDVRIEWIVSGTPSAKYTLVDFQPCAIICDHSCPSDWEEVQGLPLLFQRDDVRLYAK
jgi:hypothetical protein